MNINKRFLADWFLFAAASFGKTYQLQGLAIAFLLGRLVNEAKIENNTPAALLKSLFSPEVMWPNWLSLLAVLVILLAPATNKFLTKIIRRRNYADVFQEVLRSYRSINTSHLNGLAWGDALSIQTCPDFFKGWAVSEVEIQHASARFSMPRKLDDAYKDYFKKHYDARGFKHDGVKIYLTENPRTFSDSPSLVLKTKEALYSQVQFYKDNIARLTSERQVMVDLAVDGQINFPHSLCMHAIVITSDDKALFTQRSLKVEDYPGSWSCSIEEQMQVADLTAPGKTVIEALAERMLDEELGVTPTEFNASNIRVMSVFIETDILNISLCTHIRLDISEAELRSRLRLFPRKDYEFTLDRYLSHEDLLKELFEPAYRHHPSTSYRILFALVKHYGNPLTLEKALTKRTA